MKLEVCSDERAAARYAAQEIATRARRAVASAGEFHLALSGGRTPELLLRSLADEEVPWDRTHVFQVDERIAPAGDAARNSEQLRRALLDHVSLAPENVHLMPVETPDPHRAARDYQRLLESILGPTGRLDLVHLGLGSDGHTASLFPGDPLNESEAEIGVSQPYQGFRRMTLLRAPLNRARERLWLVTGQEKHEAVTRLRGADPTIPAAGLLRAGALLITDQAALTGSPATPT